jgi:DUF4097 and DUF4098 domain-containing protein YvlB
MLLGIITLVAAVLPPQQVDTLLPVRAGTRIQIENFNGSTSVRTWNQSQVRIVAEGDERNRLEIRNVGNQLTVKTQSRYGSPRSVDYEITVPVKTELSISGVYNDVSIDGVQAGITVETVNGDVDVRGGDGFVSLKSVEGSVHLSNAKGRISVSSVNDDVSISDASGDISADGVNGDVSLTGITSSSVSASSVNGDLVYQGTIQNDGQYSLGTHNGDVDITVPEGVNATVDVSTFNGELETFPVQLSHTSRNCFTFVLGTGNGRMNLESFQGTIRLHRPGETRRGGSGNRNRSDNYNDRNDRNGSSSSTRSKSKTKDKSDKDYDRERQ